MDCRTRQISETDLLSTVICATAVWEHVILEHRHLAYFVRGAGAIGIHAFGPLPMPDYACHLLHATCNMLDATFYMLLFTHYMLHNVSHHITLPHLNSP